MKKMDYTIGFQGGREGQKWTVTALTDRAKEQTPEPVTFAGRPEALTFLKDSQAEGYRFSGAGLVDPEQRLVKNRYSVIGGDGQLTLSGEDNGPRDTVWEIGDVMPGHDRSVGVEAIVENILQGAGVRERFGCDLAFLLRLTPFEIPRVLSLGEVKQIPELFQLAARHAKEAGFDGVELHGENGYLLDQFLQSSTNQRSDEYGGSIENRARLMLECTDAVIQVFRPGRVGMHLAPRRDIPTWVTIIRSLLLATLQRNWVSAQ